MTPPPRLQAAIDTFVIIILLTLIPSMAWVIWTSPIIHTDSPYIVAGVTAVATLLTSIVKDRVQHGFIRSLELPLRGIAFKDEEDMSSQVQLLDRSWRGVLRIDSLQDKPYIKHIVFAYLSCAILTTALVTTFTPTMGHQTVNYLPLIPATKYSFVSPGREEGLCAGLAKGWQDASQSLMWPLSNGSLFYAKYVGDCPVSRILPLVSLINPESPDKYAYVDSGVAIHRTAMGAPSHLFRGEVFQQLNREHGRALKSTRQCVPVMTRNPVSCAKMENATLEKVGQQELLLTLSDTLQRQAGYARKLDRHSVMLNYMWSDIEHDDTVGRSTVFYSAYNAPSGNVLFANSLAGTINDPDSNAGTEGGSTYVVKCSVNPQGSLEYRYVILNLQAAKEDNNSELGYARILQGEEPCTPVTESIGNAHYAAIATSQYHMTMENYGLDGYFTTTHRNAKENRGPPYAFNNSRNGLEDALGVLAALGVSTLDLRDGGSIVANAVDEKGGQARAVVDVRQLGYGNRLVLLLIIPPLLALLILIHFYLQSFRQENQPGGGLIFEPRPARYAAESMAELVSLGRRAKLV